MSGFGVITVTGADARSFLQGQLSADLGALTPQQALLASLNSAQGRVQAILTLVAHADEVLLLLPAELVTLTLARLRPYVLRSKVVLGDGSALWQVRGVHGMHATAGFQEQAADGYRLKWWSQDERALELVPRGANGGESDHGTASADSGSTATSLGGSDAWRAADIATGIARLTEPTREQFVAQMLNLDLLGGISFRKGCYTGQEIIARTQYRGAIKRRLFRFETAAPPPEPGTKLLHAAGAAGIVVDAVATATGAEFLAVVSLAALTGELQFAEGAGAIAQLPLPYDVPLA
jgi:folate-binding protein YgfZ